MNYLAHAIRFLDQPLFAAGTAIPDWLSAADRRVRLRPRDLDPWHDHECSLQSALARGAAQHLHDDDWFHGTTGFYEVTTQLTAHFRQGLGADERYHCGFLGHVGMELLLDAALMESRPDALAEYYRILDEIDPEAIEAAVNRMARVPTQRLAPFIRLFREHRFLESYSDDPRLLWRLNQVLHRVKLSPLPASAVELLADARQIVRRRVDDLLPSDRFTPGHSTVADS